MVYRTRYRLSTQVVQVYQHPSASAIEPRQRRVNGVDSIYERQCGLGATVGQAADPTVTASISHSKPYLILHYWSVL